MSREEALAELTALLGFTVEDVRRMPPPPDGSRDAWGNPWNGLRGQFDLWGRSYTRGWRVKTDHWRWLNFNSSDCFRKPQRCNEIRAHISKRDDLPPLGKAACRRVLALMHTVNEFHTKELA